MREHPLENLSRREWFHTGAATSHRRTLRDDGDQKFPGDLTILNVALGLEHQAVAAYQAGAESGLLSGDVLKMALSYQEDHKRHRDALVRFLNRFGGTPVQPLASYDFGTIQTAKEVLELAHKLEQGAVDAYLASAAKLESATILDGAAGILADEVRHATAFKLALSLPVTERPEY